MKIYQLETSTVHLDSSSFHVHGDYQRCEYESTEDLEPKTVRITYGYSRDKRPDLKQFLMNLICTNDGDVPLWMRIGDGNESDQKQFVKVMKEFNNQLIFDSLIVADSALYTQENLQLLTDIKWLSRVPVRIKAAHKLVQEIDGSDWNPSQIKGYRYQELSKSYGGIEQRWLVVESQLRRESDLKNLEKKIQKERIEVNKKLRSLKTEKFACIPDAETATRKLLKNFLYHELTQINVPEVESKSESYFSYKVQVKVSLRESKIELEKKRAGRFILATNVLDSLELTTEEMLSKYKGQQSVERGFRFLKDPLFLTDSIFLKSPHRIEALGLIMGLCLLVYTLGQRQLRQTLNRTKSTIKNQLGRPTNRPTLRWIFQCFQSIHLLINSGFKSISNLTDERLELLKFFPPSCQRYYLLSGET